MKKRKLLLAIIFSGALALGGCKDKGKDKENPPSTTPELPDAPLTGVSLSLSNFGYLDDTPAPTLSGLGEGFKDVAIAYSYLDGSGTKLGDYVSGVKNTINAGSYVLKADVSTSNYKPFSLTADFTVSKATFASFEMNGHDYDFDELLPEPYTVGLSVEGVSASYKWYSDENDKHDYVPGTVNTIVPGSYILEGTFTKANYEPVVKTYNFAVSHAQFDEAYALLDDEINIGTLDINYDLNSVNLSELLSVKTVADDQPVEGVTFSWKQAYEIVGGTPLNATVIAHKDNFVDKEYNITVNSTKKLVNMPELFGGESGTTPIGYLSYNESVQKVHLEGVDTSYVNVLAASEFEGTNAGIYHVEVSLKDPDHTCWSDSTTSNKSWNWEIHKYFVSGASTGYRIRIGGYTGIVSDTVITLDPSIVSSPCELGFDFRNQSYNWEEYEFAAFEIPNSSASYAHLNESGQLVVDDIHSFSITAKTSNPNHQFNQNYEISFEAAPSLRTLTFTPTKDAADVNGLDRTEINPNSASPGDHSNYLFRVNLSGNGACLSKQFKSVKSVSITINWTKELYPSDDPSFSVQVYLSPNTSYIGHVDDVAISHTFTSSNQTIEYDFTGKTFDPLIDYYFLMWFGGSGGGSVNITQLVVVYEV